MLTIEKAQRDDMKTILDLQYLSYQSEAELFNDRNIQPLTQTLHDLLSEYEKGIVLKATDESGAIIGSVRAYSEDGTAYIGKLMVHPQNQRQGIGSQLLSAIENEYPEHRYELFTSTRSVGNIRLYERLGYRIFKQVSVSDELQFVYLEKP